MKILFVDDSTDLLALFGLVLKAQSSHVLRTASSGEEALSIARDWHPDLVVTDVIMPGMNGLDLITHLRSDLTSPPPVIVLSGFPDLEAEALRRGAFLFQPKPINPDDLLPLLDGALHDGSASGGVRDRAMQRRAEAGSRAQRALAEAVARRPSLRTSSRLVVRFVSRYFSAPVVALLLLRDGRLHVEASSDGVRLPAGSDVTGVFRYADDVLESGASLVVPDLLRLPAMAQRARDSQVTFLVAVPVRLRQENVGCVLLADSAPRSFDASDLAIVEHMASVTSGVLDGTSTGLLSGNSALAHGDWRKLFRIEANRRSEGRALVLSLFETDLPDAGDALFSMLPPHTALGRLDLVTYALYASAETLATARAYADTSSQLLTERLGVRYQARLASWSLPSASFDASLIEIARGLLNLARAYAPPAYASINIIPEVQSSNGDVARARGAEAQ